MSEYTPTTVEIRDRASRSSAYPQFQSPTLREDFDRWLAAHDAEVREEAWDEGFADRHGLPERSTFLGDRFARNPYRKEQ